MDHAITLLIFSRNDTNRARDLINGFLSIVNEVVVIDSSDEMEHKKFKTWSEQTPERKVTVYYTVPLGYPDMLRPYALTKCKNDWVLMLDVDERASEELKTNLNSIIDSDIADVYALYRYASSKDGKRLSNLRSAQVRFFNKDYLDEKGIIHKLPTSKGRYATLPEKYYISHLVEEKFDRSIEYDKFERYDRLSYGGVPERFRSILKFLHIKGSIAPEIELTSVDYLIFFYLKELYSSIITRNCKRMINAFNFAARRTRSICDLKNTPEGNISFEISKIINKVGIVKYLELDKPEVVDAITERFRNSNVKGSQLLIHLLEAKYNDSINV